MPFRGSGFFSPAVFASTGVCWSEMRFKITNIWICIKTIFEGLVSRKVELIWYISRPNGGNNVYVVFMFILWRTNSYQLYLHSYILDLLCRLMWIGSNFEDSSLSGQCEYIVCPDKIGYIIIIKNIVYLYTTWWKHDSLSIHGFLQN